VRPAFRRRKREAMKRGGCREACEKRSGRRRPCDRWRGGMEMTGIGKLKGERMLIS
jgi:hypothetical protein